MRATTRSPLYKMKKISLDLMEELYSIDKTCMHSPHDTCVNLCRAWYGCSSPRGKMKGDFLPIMTPNCEVRESSLADPIGNSTDEVKGEVDREWGTDWLTLSLLAMCGCERKSSWVFSRCVVVRERSSEDSWLVNRGSTKQASWARWLQLNSDWSVGDRPTLDWSVGETSNQG